MGSYWPCVPQYEGGVTGPVYLNTKERSLALFTLIQRSGHWPCAPQQEGSCTRIVYLNTLLTSIYLPIINSAAKSHFVFSKMAQHCPVSEMSEATLIQHYHVNVFDEVP